MHELDKISNFIEGLSSPFKKNCLKAAQKVWMMLLLQQKIFNKSLISSEIQKSSLVKVKSKYHNTNAKKREK